MAPRAGDALDAVLVFEEEVQEDRDRHDAGTDAEGRQPRPPQAGNGLQTSPRHAEGHLLHTGAGSEREPEIDRGSARRFIDAGEQRPGDERRNGQQDEPHPPTDDVCEQCAQQDQPAAHRVGSAMEAVYPAVLHRRVVVGEQAHVHGFVHHPTDAGAEAGDDEQSEDAHETREPGQDAASSPTPSAATETICTRLRRSA